jgi:hypothetical protein
MRELRREGPRIGIQALCWELVAGRERSGLAVDLSPGGLRIERPYTGGPTVREVPLQLEVPDLDEIMWARGEVCFDVIVPAPPAAGGTFGLVRRTGYRLAGAAARDLRVLEELVRETHRMRAAREREREQIDLQLASCYLRA